MSIPDEVMNELQSLPDTMQREAFLLWYADCGCI